MKTAAKRVKRVLQQELSSRVGEFTTTILRNGNPDVIKQLLHCAAKSQMVPDIQTAFNELRLDKFFQKAGSVAEIFCGGAQSLLKPNAGGIGSKNTALNL